MNREKQLEETTDWEVNLQEAVSLGITYLCLPMDCLRITRSR